MRGSNQQQSHVFSYISPEQRVRKDHPLRPIRTIGGQNPEATVAAVQQDVRESGAPVDTAGAVVAGATVAAVVFGAERAAVDGRDGLQHFVPVVCGTEFGRSGVGRDGLHEEPRPVAGGGSGEGISGAGGGASAPEGLDLGRALYGGRHVTRSLGQLEEFSAEGERETGCVS